MEGFFFFNPSGTLKKRKKTISDMKNSLHRMNIRLNTTEGTISELNDIAVKLSK